MNGDDIGGGGSIAVDTDEMQQAARAVAATGEALDAVLGRARGIGSDSPDLAIVLAAIAGARDRCHDAADGLRTAAIRYGAAEYAATSFVTSVTAAIAAGVGSLQPVLLLAGGPIATLAVDGALVMIATGAIGVRLLQEHAETGPIPPQLDPVLLGSVRLLLSSLDDATRGFLHVESPLDLLRNDPAGPFGSESTAAMLAAIVGGFHPASSGLRLRSRAMAKPVDAPADLAGLVARVPDAKDGRPQVRIERYGEDGSRRWIVYIAGTATFSPRSGTEPFDMTSNLQGVAQAPSESETAVIDGMREAGVRPDEPVLLVGHSQGALDAVRVAQDGGFTVGGVVQVGGPSGQIALPAAVPVLSAEHDQDLVPALGGVAATGVAGLNRVLVTRDLPNAGRMTGGSPLEQAFPAHRLEPYEETLRLAQASGDPRVDRFVGQVQPFLDGRNGSETLVRADRIPAPPPPPREPPKPPPTYRGGRDADGTWHPPVVQ